jgi:uncharacterized protein YrrD
MQKASDIVGRAVVSSESGERLGSVADLLLDQASTRVLGLIVGGGLFTTEHVLPYGNVQTLGRDAVLARTHAGLLDPQQWRAQKLEAARSSTLKHRRVFTTAGRALGEIDDVYVDDETGGVRGFEVVGSGFAGLARTRTMLGRAGELTVGPDAVLVPEDLAAAASEPAEPRT